jgi:hypothetical protein
MDAITVESILNSSNLSSDPFATLRSLLHADVYGTRSEALKTGAKIFMALAAV